MSKSVSELQLSTIRFFPLESRDPGFMLFKSLPLAYLLTLLIDKLGYELKQFRVTYVYPFSKCMEKIIDDLNTGNLKEDFFIFSLENFYHSSDHALGFFKQVIEHINVMENPPSVILHSFKTPVQELQNIIEMYQSIHLIIHGEIEHFFDEYISEKKSLADIPNIIYREGGKVFSSSEAKVVGDLEKYILGAYHSKYFAHFPKVKDQIISYLDDDNTSITGSSYYTRPKNQRIDAFRKDPDIQIMLTTGRGCKYKCDYCFRGAKFSDVRQIPLQIIKKDLDMLVKLGYTDIYFYDDCFFTTNFSRLEPLVELFSHYPFRYSISGRYEMCTPYVLGILSKVNISFIQVGLQSTSIQANKENSRMFLQKKFEKVFEGLHKQGIFISLDIIMGLPGEGLQDFISTFDYALSLKPSGIVVNTLFLNPGTKLYEKKEQYGITTYQGDSLFHAKGVLESDTFSRKELEEGRKYVAGFLNMKQKIQITLR